jgi:hypothetical protein
VARRQSSVRVAEVQSDASKAYDNVDRGAVWRRAVHAVGEGMPPFLLATLRFSLLSYAWPRDAVIGTRGFPLGAFRRGLTPGSAGATAELKLSMASPLLRIFRECRSAAADEQVSLVFQGQVYDSIATATGEAPSNVIRWLYVLWSRIADAARFEIGLSFA